MLNLLELLSKWEPLWLLLILSIEMMVGIVTMVILIIEYKYDWNWNQQLLEAKKRRKKLDFNELCQGESK